MLRTLPDDTLTYLVTWSTYLTADLAADLVGAAQTAANRQVGAGPDADDCATTAALYLAPTLVGSNPTPDDLRAATWSAVRTIARRLTDDTGTYLVDGADLVDLVDRDPAAVSLTTGQTPDPAAPYRTTLADLADLAADLLATDHGAVAAWSVLAGVRATAGGTGPAPTMRTAVRIATGGKGARPEDTRAGRAAVAYLRPVLADLVTYGRAAVAYLASGAADAERPTGDSTMSAVRTYLASLPVDARRATWTAATADLAVTLAATPADLVTPCGDHDHDHGREHRPHLAAADTWTGSAVIRLADPARADRQASRGVGLPPFHGPAAVVVTVDGRTVATYGPDDYRAAVAAWSGIGQDTYRPTTADHAADRFAARQESPGKVAKPSRKGSRVGSTGPTIPARLSR
jgi:hypothetical protein